MSKFGEVVGAHLESAKKTKYDQVLSTLKQMNDGSDKDFLMALEDDRVSNASLSTLIEGVTGIIVAKSTVHEWRRTLGKA